MKIVRLWTHTSWAASRPLAVEVRKEPVNQVRHVRPAHHIIYPENRNNSLLLQPRSAWFNKLEAAPKKFEFATAVRFAGSGVK
jgi:hypothetical protein